MSCALADVPFSARMSIPSGSCYRIAPLPTSAYVTPMLAAELARVLERFAMEAGFSPERPVEILFKPGVVGHHPI